MEKERLHLESRPTTLYHDMTRNSSRLHVIASSVYRYGPLLLIPVWIGLFLPLPWQGVSVFAAVAYHASRWVAVGSPFPASRFNLPVLLLVTFSSLSLAFSPAPDLGAIALLQLIAGVTFYFVTFDHIDSPQGLSHPAAALALFGICLALAAPFTVNWNADKVFPIPFFYDLKFPPLLEGTNPNIMAGALAPIVPVTLGLLGGHGRRLRSLGVISFAFLLVVLLLLQSRGALFALAAGLGVWATLNRRWVLPLIPLVILAALALNNLNGGPPPAQLIYGKIGTPTGGTLIERQALWTQAVLLIRESPLIGIGLGAYPRVAPYAPFYPVGASGLIFTHAHNLFLQIALDTGIIGLAAFLVMVLFALFAALRAYSARIERSLAIGLVAAIIVVLVHGLGDTIMWEAKSIVVLWTLFGMAMGLDKLTHRARLLAPNGERK